MRAGDQRVVIGHARLECRAGSGRVNPQTGCASGSCRRARGAVDEHRDRRADQFLDPAHVLDRLRGQLGPGARAGGRAAPALHLLVDRLDARLRTLARRKIVERLAVEPIADADPQSSNPSSTSSFVSAMPSMPEVLTVWRTRVASNQPQRRLRPVTVPNSRPRCRSARRSRRGARSGTAPRRPASCRPWRCRARSRRRPARGPSRSPPGRRRCWRR